MRQPLLQTFTQQYLCSSIETPQNIPWSILGTEEIIFNGQVCHVAKLSKLINISASGRLTSILIYLTGGLWDFTTPPPAPYLTWAFMWDDVNGNTNITGIDAINYFNLENGRNQLYSTATDQDNVGTDLLAEINGSWDMFNIRARNRNPFDVKNIRMVFWYTASVGDTITASVPYVGGIPFEVAPTDNDKFVLKIVQEL